MKKLTIKIRRYKSQIDRRKQCADWQRREAAYKSEYRA